MASKFNVNVGTMKKPQSILPPHPDPRTIPNRDLKLLHPSVRGAVEEILYRTKQEGIPFAVYEGYRSPERQSWLYEQGRSRPGAVITKAPAWHSFHQFGLAVDFALKDEKGNWSWDTGGAKMDWWERLHDLGNAYGLEPITSEMPHLQLMYVTIKDLMVSSFPGGGDAKWYENLEKSIFAWKGMPKGPTINVKRDA